MPTPDQVRRDLDATSVAIQAGTNLDKVRRLTALGLLQQEREGAYAEADVRRVQVVEALERAGLAVEDLARLVRSGAFSLEFLDRAGRGVFTTLSEVTFAALSRTTGVPFDTLAVIREATGGRRPEPGDLVREDELRVAPLVARQHRLGFRPRAIVRAVRVYGDSLRRIAEAEAEWWRSEVQDPMLEEGASAEELVHRSGDISPDLSRDTDAALMAIYHAQQMLVWSVNLAEGITAGLERAGLHRRETMAPAMCFLDLTGYTTLTQEHGDAKASQLVERLNHIVRRIAVDHGGRPTKWLGDGVMLHFPDPAEGVEAAVAMVNAIAGAGLPPAHVGLHAGPVIVQQGDFYGHTVNVAARVGDFARPGEVLVTRAAMESAAVASVDYVPMGPIELKGLANPLELFVAAPREAAGPTATR
jgi:adenylate cyclase